MLVSVTSVVVVFVRALIVPSPENVSLEFDICDASKSQLFLLKLASLVIYVVPLSTVTIS